MIPVKTILLTCIIATTTQSSHVQEWKKLVSKNLNIAINDVEINWEESLPKGSYLEHDPQAVLNFSNNHLLDKLSYTDPHSELISSLSQKITDYHILIHAQAAAVGATTNKKNITFLHSRHVVQILQNRINELKIKS